MNKGSSKAGSADARKKLVMAQKAAYQKRYGQSKPKKGGKKK